jgi:hypothetical protein
MEGGRGQPHYQGARPSPWPRQPMVRLPGPPPDAAPSPIKSPRWEKPKGRISFPQTYCKPPSSPSWDREDPGALPGTLPEAFYTTMVAFGVLCE